MASTKCQRDDYIIINIGVTTYTTSTEDQEYFRSAFSSDIGECSIFPQNFGVMKRELNSAPDADNVIVYFTGHGGCDSKRGTYIIISKNTLILEKVYLRDLVRELKKKFKRCLCFFELYPAPEGIKVHPSLMTLPTCRDCVLGVSDLYKEKINRLSLSDAGPAPWTKHLADNIKKMGNCSIVDALAATWWLTIKEIKKPQVLIEVPCYTASIDVASLNLPVHMIELSLESTDFASSLPSLLPYASLPSVPQASLPYTSLSFPLLQQKMSLKYKVDTRIIVDDPDTAAEEIKEIAKDWKKLGCQLSLNIAELNQIESFSTNNKLAVVLKKKQAKNYAERRHFHYFELMTAVRNVDKDIYNSLMK